jgi:hypothetical protein
MEKLAWFGRFVIFIFTFGYAFPHVCVEGMDLSEPKEKT